jgi:hypothetical protein
MYFGAGRGDPRMATSLLGTIVGHAYHPATKAAASHVPNVVATVTADLAFSVTEDQAETLAEQDLPQLGHYDSLLTPVRWSSAAACEFADHRRSLAGRTRLSAAAHRRTAGRTARTVRRPRDHGRHGQLRRTRAALHRPCRARHSLSCRGRG